MRKIAVLFIGLLVMAQAGCANGEQYALIKEFKAPDTAQNIQRIELAQNTQQLYFEIVRKYPDVSVLDKYQEQLLSNNWIKCETNSRQWEVFEDRSSTPHLLTHQTHQYWIDVNANKLASLSVHYYSKNISQNIPDNDVQRVAVWVQKASGIYDEIARLGLKCSTKPNTSKTL